MKFYIPILFVCFLRIHSTSTKSILEQLIPKEKLDNYGLAIEAIFSLGIRLQAIMDESPNANFVVSPLSTTAIISQLMMGAEGVFQDQLYKLLSLPKPDHSYMVNNYGKDGNETRLLPYGNFHLQLSALLKTLQRRKPGEKFDLNLSNALFYNQDIELKNDFMKYLYKLYDTEIKALNFYKDTSSLINSWASEHTNGLIKSVLSSAPPPSTTSMFLNSIYFRADWETPFSDLLNTRGKFHTNENTTVDVDYMMGNIPLIPYTATKDYKMICLPYKNRELGMYLFFPNPDNENKYNIRAFTEKLNPQEIFSAIAKSKLHDVIVKIPKLSLTNRVNILKPLQKYTEYKKVSIESKSGNGNAIDDILHKVNDFKNFSTPVVHDIMLTGAAKGVDLRVSDIVQQMVFSINEKGTEAAAISLGITDYMGGAKVMVFNRPFVFFIRHEETDALIFWGTIADPSRN
nr:serpin-Z10-like [Leptinotarsa decemlineata]